MKVFLFLLFTFFLDITFNLYININLLYPMFTLSSLIILYFLIKNKNNYLILSIILGFIYDLIYSSNFINTVLFFIISLIIKNIFNKNISIIKILFTFLIIIFIYDLSLFLYVVIVNKYSYSLNIFLNKYLSSLIINFIYIIIFCRKKYYKKY